MCKVIKNCNAGLKMLYFCKHNGEYIYTLPKTVTMSDFVRAYRPASLRNFATLIKKG